MGDVVGTGGAQCRVPCSAHRTSGATGETNSAAGNLDLLVNTFYRTFTTQITLTDQAKALPTLRGSGRVRDLSEAISLSHGARQGLLFQTQGF